MRKILTVIGLVLGSLAWAFLVCVLGLFTDLSFSAAGWAFLGIGCWIVPAAIVAGMLRGRLRIALLVGVLAVSLSLSVAWWWDAPPSHGRIRAVADRTQLPADWLLEESKEAGNTWGLWGYYPEINRTYAADPAEIPAAAAELERAGWHAEPWGEPPGTQLSRGRWRIFLSEQRPAGDHPQVRVSWHRY